MLSRFSYLINQLPILLRNERPSDLIMEYANIFTTHQWANTYTLTKHMTEKLLMYDEK